MSRTIVEHSLFKSKSSKAESKADTTSHAARAIIRAEVERRDAKTARLKQARLEREAAQAATETPATPRRAKAAVPRRARSST